MQVITRGIASTKKTLFATSNIFSTKNIFLMDLGAMTYLWSVLGAHYDMI